MVQSTPADRKCEEQSATDTKSTATSAPSSAPKRTIRVLEGQEASVHHKCGWGRHEATKLLSGEAVHVQVEPLNSSSSSSAHIKVFEAVGATKVEGRISQLPPLAPLTWAVLTDREREEAATDDNNTVGPESPGPTA